MHALARAHGTQPDVIFIDAVLPDMSGLELCRVLREDPRIADGTPILITTPHAPTREQRVAGLRAGAWDCLVRLTDPEELVLRLDAYLRAKRDADRARAEGLVDPVTGLYNRQGMARRAVELGSQAFRQRGALACVVLAVDLEPGVAAGEAAAAAIVQCVQVLKTAGRVFHFPVVLYDTDYWGELMGWIKGELLADGMISPDDLDLLFVTDDLEEVVERVRAGYEAVANVGYAPIKPMDLLIRASAALRRGAPVTGHSSIRRYDEGGGATPT